MTDEHFIATAGGGILYDASRIGKPDEEMFSRQHWAQRGALQEITGGRASIALLDTGSERWVLRHAWRQVGDTRWHYEVLDGAGGANGRIRDAMFNVRAVAAGADPTTGKATSPVYVAYVVNRPSGNNVRLATLH